MKIVTLMRSVFRFFGQIRKLRKSSDGAAAIEFAILAIPYFMIIFAIIETFIAFTGEQLVSNAVENMSRKLRTGQITYKVDSTTDKEAEQFRQLFCNEIAIMITCSTTEAKIPQKLFIDARTFTNFADMPSSVPVKNGDLDTSAFKYEPGGPGTINMLRAYYKWQVMTDLIRPYISNIRPTDASVPSYFLIVATSAYQNEPRFN
ncbi:pilus assembly protein [Rhizobium sp. CG4]|nr:pilus assembly protein [Rhizobium sp. CG4]